MSGCPLFFCFPRYKAYTQVNATQWDMRGNYAAQEPMSYPRFPAPPNSGVPPRMRQPTPTYPAPFNPLGPLTAPPQRRPTPNTHPSYHTFPRSAVVPKATADTTATRVIPGRPPRTTALQPALVQSSHHNSGHHNHKGTRYPSRSVSAATSRHVHYADEIAQPRSRKISAQSSSGAPVVPVASTSRHLHPGVSQQPPQGHRRRAHSTGTVAAPVAVNFIPSQSQRQARSNIGHKYSRCTGRKKALCIGINYTGQKRQLRGCINDIKNVKRFLTRQWGFHEGDIVMLMDQTTNPRQMPTRKNMIDAMKWLVKDAKPHDSLFFHYSGHGGQIPDTHGDEISGLDEVIYPVDYKTAGVIVDDELHQIMVKPLPPGCRLTAIFDSCHSGTTLDLPFMYHHDGRLKEPNFTEFARPKKMSSADVISFAACNDDQTSADTVQGGVAVGAMSYAFLTSLTRKPVQSYLELLLSIRAIVQPHFKQKAQLSSGHYIDTHLRFIL